MSQEQWFIGESHHKVDTKGRVSIPAPFRRVLSSGDPDFIEGGNPQVVIVYGDGKRNYLQCMTLASLNKIQRKIIKLPPASLKRRALQRLYSTQTIVTSVDETGRLVLPAKLRNKVEIDGEAIFAGTGEYFEIWSPTVYDQSLDIDLSGEEEGYDPDADASIYLHGDEDFEDL